MKRRLRLLASFSVSQHHLLPENQPKKKPQKPPKGSQPLFQIKQLRMSSLGLADCFQLFSPHRRHGNKTARFAPAIASKRENSRRLPLEPHAAFFSHDSISRVSKGVSVHTFTSGVSVRKTPRHPKASTVASLLSAAPAIGRRERRP